MSKYPSLINISEPVVRIYFNAILSENNPKVLCDANIKVLKLFNQYKGFDIKFNTITCSSIRECMAILDKHRIIDITPGRHELTLSLTLPKKFTDKCLDMAYTVKVSILNGLVSMNTIYDAMSRYGKIHFISRCQHPKENPPIVVRYCHVEDVEKAIKHRHIEVQDKYGKAYLEIYAVQPNHLSAGKNNAGNPVASIQDTFSNAASSSDPWKDDFDNSVADSDDAWKDDFDNGVADSDDAWKDDFDNGVVDSDPSSSDAWNGTEVTYNGGASSSDSCGANPDMIGNTHALLTIACTELGQKVAHDMLVNRHSNNQISNSSTPYQPLIKLLVFFGLQSVLSIIIRNILNLSLHQHYCQRGRAKHAVDAGVPHFAFFCLLSHIMYCDCVGKRTVRQHFLHIGLCAQIDPSHVPKNHQVIPSNICKICYL